MRVRELIRFAVGGLWRQKVRSALTLLGVTVGTAALAFSIALGLGLRAFIDREFQGKDEFWRFRVRIGEPNAPDNIPPEKIAVHGVMSAERQARIRDALTEKYLNEGPRKPPIILTPEKVAVIAALPDVAEVRTFRTDTGRVWLGDRSAQGLTAAGRLGGLRDRVLFGQLPRTDDAAEVVLSEFTLYELGVRDDAAVAAAIGQRVQLDVGGGVRNAQPIALARALTGRLPDEQFSRGQAIALGKLAAALPNSLDSFDLTPADRAALKDLLERKPEQVEKRTETARLATGEFQIAGVVRLVTREERKKADPLTSIEIRQADIFLPPVTGEAMFGQLPWAKEAGFHSAEVWV